MKGIPSKVEVVACGPLPLYRVEILKDLIRKAALRKLARMNKSIKDAAQALKSSSRPWKANTLISKEKGEEVKFFAFLTGLLYPYNYLK